MQGINFIAIDFETATGQRASICEAGICAVLDVEIVAHNAAFDIGRNNLDYLCDQFKIPYGQHHRAGDDAEMCARLLLRELEDAGWRELEEMEYCNGKL